MDNKSSQGRAATIKDVAKLAGVSISTVSRIINNTGGVSEDLEERIKKAIEELNYRPNSIARALKSKTSKSIGLIIPSIMNPVFPPLVKVIEDTASRYGFSVILCNSDGLIENELKYISLLKEKQVDGIILNSMGMYDKSANNVITEDTPIVVIGKKIDEILTTNVTINNYRGAYDMTKYLIDIGMRNIAFIAGELESVSAVNDRYEGYKKALADNNIDLNCEYVVKGIKYTNKDSYDFETILSKGIKLDAVFTTDDIVAITCIDTLFRYGYRVPDDISVTGFGDIFMASVYRPHLTTVRIPIDNLGVEVVKAMLRIILAKRDKKSEVVLEPEIVIRDSTKRQ